MNPAVNIPDPAPKHAAQHEGAGFTHSPGQCGDSGQGHFAAGGVEIAQGTAVDTADEARATSPGQNDAAAASPAPGPDNAEPVRDTRLMAKAHERLTKIERWTALVHGGCNSDAAAVQIGVPLTTLYRWRRAYIAIGLDGLLDHTERCGRRSELLACVTQELRARVRDLANRTGSVQLAWDLVADESVCPPMLAEYIRQSKRIPLSLLRAGHVTDESKMKLRGARHYSLHSRFNLRDMVEVIDGQPRRIEPGDWWVFDDMSANQPFWFEVPQTWAQGDRLVERFGCAIGRQGLWGMDVGCGFWLGHELIGRPRDAYRAEDILRFLRKLIQSYGLPRRGIVLERGVWASRRIRGAKFAVDARDEIMAEDQVLVGMPDETKSELELGIRALGIELVYTYGPHSMGKAFIEGGFNRLQSLMSATRHADMGRTRGEYEAVARAIRSVSAGVRHPTSRGFGYIGEVSESFAWAEDWINGHRKQGRLHCRVPHDAWSECLAASPLRPIRRDELSVFLPERRDLQIRGGHITPVIDGQPYPFIAPEMFAELGNGYRLSVAWDPAEPTLGAALYNMETSSANVHGWRRGQFVGWAEFEPLSPQMGLDPDGGERRENRRRYDGYHRADYRDQKAAHEAAARDGRGNAVVLNSGTPTTPEPFRRIAAARPRKPELPLATRSTTDDFVDMPETGRRPISTEPVSDDALETLDDVLESSPRAPRGAHVDEQDVDRMLSEI